jgi:polar amino acid transport system substrate-binding protein
MKKIIAMLLTVILALGCFAACTPAVDNGPQTTAPAADATQGTTEAGQEAASDLAEIQNNGKIVVGITEYEPMDYKDENGEWTGFDAELARLFAEELDVECEFFVLADWGKKFVELETKSIDCVWNGMTITDEALNNASVSDPYVINAQVVVMKADKIAQYTDAESMKELTIAVEEGSAGQTVAEEAGLTTIAKQDQAMALMEVASGTADACVIDITMANAMTGEGTDYADLAKGISLSEEEYGVAFRQESDLTAKLNEFLDKLAQDGTLQQLADKYELTLAE